jgi:hypothetical protein
VNPGTSHWDMPTETGRMVERNLEKKIKEYIIHSYPEM